MRQPISPPRGRFCHPQLTQTLLSHTRDAGHTQINSKLGEIESIDSRSLASTWSDLKSNYRKEFVSPDLHLSPDRQAKDCENTEQWFGSVWHLNNVLTNAKAKHPEANLADFYARRAWAHGEIGKPKETAEDASTAVELGTTEQNARYWLALACLADREFDGYRKACLDMLERCDPMESPEITNRAVWACVLVPDAIGEPERLVRVAEQLVNTANAREPKQYANLYRYLNTFGAALYRAGKYSDARDQFRNAENAYTKLLNVERRERVSQDAEGMIWDWLLLAMTHQQLGNADEAREWFNKAKQVIDQPAPERFPDAIGGPSMAWTQKLALKLLYEEADRMVTNKKDHDSDQK